VTRRAAFAGPRQVSLLLAALVLAVYLPDLRNGFVYDDHEVVLQQAPIRTPAEIARVFAEPHGLPQSQLPYYRPITRATLLLQKGIHGDVAVWFHLGNAVVMSLAAVLAFDLLRRPSLALSPWAAAWTAAAFAVHPIASECVHPIASGRESSIPAVFMIATLAAWMRGRRAVAHLCFAAALWSKEQAITVPLLVAWAEALRVAPDPPGRNLRVWLRRMAPFAIVTAAYLCVRVAVVPRREANDVLLLRLTEHWSAHPFAPLEAGLFLLQSALAPRFALAYEPAFATWFSPGRSLLASGVFAIVVTLLVARRALGFPRRVVAFWLGWMPIAMLLNANLLPLEAPFAERYLFVSSLGIAALVAAVGDRLVARGRAPRAVLAAGLATLAILASMTIHRSVTYRDEIAFTRQWVATSPLHANAQASHGAALARAGRDAEAIVALREAVRLEPALAAAHYNLGVVLARTGAHVDAIAALRAAVRVWNEDADAHYALGALLAGRGDDDEAAAHLRRALAVRPGWPEAEAALERVEAKRR
jgi:tetratricopeptide (TPR) repeat protein